MASALINGFGVAGNSYGVLRMDKNSISDDSVRVVPLKSNVVKGKQLMLTEQPASPDMSFQAIYIPRPRKLMWWQKDIKANMKEIQSAEDLAESLLTAGDKLTVVHFYSSGCGACRFLHPKVCQLAGANPEVQFLTVNFEEQKELCCSLHVHVLPLFRFYRGQEGRLCSFSCNIATIHKLKDALAKHGAKRESPAPAKGLEESELLSLPANIEMPVAPSVGASQKIHGKATNLLQMV